jgi:hypothetical protein
MSRIEFEPWEPEESVGKLWHAFASRLDADPVHDGARVLLSQVGGRLAVLFRGLGGDAAVEIKPVGMETSHHRLSFLRKLGTWAETSPRASFDGATLRLPESLAVFPVAEANAALYVWLAAAAVALRDREAAETSDPLQADLAAIETARAMTEPPWPMPPASPSCMPTSARRRCSSAAPRICRRSKRRSRRASAPPWVRTSPCRRCPPRPRAAIARSGPCPLARPAHPVAQRHDRRREPPDRRVPRGSGRGKDRPPRPPPQGRPGRPQRQLHPAQVRSHPVDDRIPQPQPPGRG